MSLSKVLQVSSRGSHVSVTPVCVKDLLSMSVVCVGVRVHVPKTE